MAVTRYEPWNVVSHRFSTIQRRRELEELTRALVATRSRLHSSETSDIDGPILETTGSNCHNQPGSPRPANDSAIQPADLTPGR